MNIYDETVREAVFSTQYLNHQDAIIIVSSSGQILRINPAAQHLFDLAGSDGERIAFPDLFHDPRQAQSLLQRFLERNWVRSEEVELKIRNGEVVSARISGSTAYACADRPTMIVATIRPKAKHVEAEDLLERERNFISAILETTGALVILLDNRGCCIRINDSFQQMTGFSIIDLLGLNFCEQMLPDRETAAFRKAFLKTVKHEYPVRHQGLLITKDARHLQVVWTLTALKNGENAMEYIICTGIDITELQAAKEQIRTLKGLIPICSFCKKIRDDQGYWKILEEYIRDHSEANFSHSMCPDCQKKNYPHYKKNEK